MTTLPRVNGLFVVNSVFKSILLWATNSGQVYTNNSKASNLVIKNIYINNRQFFLISYKYLNQNSLTITILKHVQGKITKIKNKIENGEEKNETTQNIRLIKVNLH